MSKERIIKKMLKDIEKNMPDKVRVERALYRIGSLLEKKTKEQIVKQKLVDLGGLMNSFRFTVTRSTKSKKSDYLVLEFGSYGVPYARIHEFGTVGAGGSLPDIVPRNKRFLTIPKAPWAKRRRAKDFNLVRMGRVLVDPDKLPNNMREGEPIPENAIGFILAKRARIKPKRYMQKALRQARPTIIEILRELGQ
jgi:hypothetical protein